MIKRKGILTALLLAAGICGGIKADSREDELAYLRIIMPEPLLRYARLEVASTTNITIVGEGMADF